MLFRPRLLLPLAFALGACDFFTLDEPDDSAGGAPATGGTGGSGGTGGASGGVGGVGGATGGASGVGGAGAGGTAGDTSTGGAGGAGTGGMAGTAGEAAGMAGIGAAGAATGGASGDGGTPGMAGNAGSGPAGAGGGGPVNCASIQAEAYNGHCYLLNTGAATWSDARAECMSRAAGGHLVTITSQGEQDFVWGIAMQDAWMGATDGLADDAPGNGTPSTWITGEDIAQFNGWTSGEPNNYEKTCPSGSGTCYEHCGFMQMSSSGGWNDEICGFEKPYVCEWDSGG